MSNIKLIEIIKENDWIEKKYEGYGYKFTVRGKLNNGKLLRYNIPKIEPIKKDFYAPVLEFNELGEIIQAVPSPLCRYYTKDNFSHYLELGNKVLQFMEDFEENSNEILNFKN